MKAILTLASMGLLLALLASPAQAEILVNDSMDVSMEVFVPCANGGAGEVVALSGPLHTLISFTVNGNEVSGTTHFQPQGISGVGLTTGDTYRGVGVTQDHFAGSLQNTQFSYTSVNNFRIIGQGPGNNFTLHETFHLTFTASGSIAVLHDNFTADCK